MKRDSTPRDPFDDYSFELHDLEYDDLEESGSINPSRKMFDAIQKERRLDNGEVQNYIDTEGKGVGEAMSEIIKDKDLILIGDHHTDKPRMEEIRFSIAQSLEQLHDRGLTKLFLEIDETSQEAMDSVDFNDPDAVKKLRDFIPPLGAFDSNIAVILEAKRLGIPVVCFDNHDGVEGVDLNAIAGEAYVARENLRERRMSENINRNMDDTDKGLIVVGDLHLMASNTSESYDHISLGKHLRGEYNEKLAAVRYVEQTRTFRLSGDNDALRPMDIAERPPTIAPDSGPVMAWEKYKSDYIIF